LLNEDTRILKVTFGSTEAISKLVCMRLSLNILMRNAVVEFWVKVRRSYQEEQFCLGLYLLAPEGNGLLTSLFIVAQDNGAGISRFKDHRGIRCQSRVGDRKCHQRELLRGTMTCADQAYALRVSRAAKAKREPTSALRSKRRGCRFFRESGSKLPRVEALVRCRDENLPNRANAAIADSSRTCFLPQSHPVDGSGITRSK
jgi:hypothetical protein